MNRLYFVALSLAFCFSRVHGDEPAPGKPASAPPSQTTSGERRGLKKLSLINAEGATVTLWKPDLSTQTLAQRQGDIAIPSTGLNNYHALVVERDWGYIKESVTRYEYLSGKPSKQSPSKLTEAVKSEFEIVPDPIPREHYRYYAGHRWGFILRLHGKPKAGVKLILKTENGTQLQAFSSQLGRVAFRLPEDFPDMAPGERDLRSAEFAISATTATAGTSYETMLTARYSVNPSHWRSTKMGVFVTGLGFIVGGLLGRIKHQGSKQA